jgi:plasmid stabilization system protein ParE
MTFPVEITPIAESQIEKAYQWYRERNPEFADCWFRELMNAIALCEAIHVYLSNWQIP